MEDFIEIKDYKNLKCLIPKKTYYWSKLVICIFLISIILICLLKFNYYYETQAMYYENNSMLKINVTNNDLDKITKNNKLIIDNIEYDYNIYKIKNELVNGYNIQQYNEVLIDLNLNNKYKIKNNLIDIKIKYNEKKVFKIIIDFILGKEN